MIVNSFQTQVPNLHTPTRAMAYIQVGHFKVFTDLTRHVDHGTGDFTLARKLGCLLHDLCLIAITLGAVVCLTVMHATFRLLRIDATDPADFDIVFWGKGRSSAASRRVSFASAHNTLPYHDNGSAGPATPTSALSRSNSYSGGGDGGGGGARRRYDAPTAHDYSVATTCWLERRVLKLVEENDELRAQV